MTIYAAPGQTAASVRAFALDLRARAARQVTLAAAETNRSRIEAHTLLASNFARRANDYDALADALEKETSS